MARSYRYVLWLLPAVSGIAALCAGAHSALGQSPQQPPDRYESLPAPSAPRQEPLPPPTDSGIAAPPIGGASEGSGGGPLFSSPFSGQSSGTENLPAPDVQGQNVVDIRVDGNKQVSLAKIASFITTRKDRPLDKAIITEDIRKLYQTRLFANVRTQYINVDGGVVIVFTVVERPTLQYVNYYGAREVYPAILARHTDLKIGEPVDPYAVSEAKRKIEDYYKEKGFNRVRVEILEGTKPTDLGASFLITEGPEQRFSSITFENNTLATDARLKTQIQSKTPWFVVIGGYVSADKINSDVEMLTLYYRALGYLKAQVAPELEFNEDGTKADLTFVINEGPRYRIGNVRVVGATKFHTEDLQGGLTLVTNDYFDELEKNTDLMFLKDAYGAYGYIMADVNLEIRYYDESTPVVDLVYTISEGSRYRIGKIKVEIAGIFDTPPHTNEHTVLNRLGFKPGEIVDVRKLRDAERRLMASGLFNANPAEGPMPQVIVKPAKENDDTVADRKKQATTRGQSPDNAPPPRRGGSWPLPRMKSDPRSEAAAPEEPAVVTVFYRPPAHTQAPQHRAVSQRTDSHPAHAHRGVQHQARKQPQPMPWSRETADAGVPRAARPPIIRRQDQGGWGAGGTNPNPQAPPQGGAFGASPFTGGPAPNGFQDPPQGVPRADEGFPAEPVPGGFVVPGEDPSLAPPGGYVEEPIDYADIFARASETTTGRFSIGVAVSSDAGLLGNIVLEERNFSIWRPPTSWQDILNNTAWKGDGQQFRIELVPGDEFQRYSVTFAEPFLFDTPISFSISGFFFDRRYEDWDEQRTGGNFGFGYLVTPDLALRTQLRAEEVDIRNPRFPTPPEVTDVLGDNMIYEGLVSLTHDTRDHAFLPTEGHFLSASFGQTFGDFSFPRAIGEARQYFMLHQRPDRSGRHVIGLRGMMGVTGTHTPVFENFFAGGFSTIRGFDFREASPKVLGTTVGGEFMLLASAEYLFPITADDMVRGVIFLDTGTVEESVKLQGDTYRVAPGIGLRVSIPGMGPAPLALDFAWAVNHADFDDTRVFTLNVSALR